MVQSRAGTDDRDPVYDVAVIGGGIVGLATAALTTRFGLVHLLGNRPHDAAQSPWLAALWRRVSALPRPRWQAICAICVGPTAALSRWCRAKTWACDRCCTLRWGLCPEALSACQAPRGGCGLMRDDWQHLRGTQNAIDK